MLGLKKVYGLIPSMDDECDAKESNLMRAWSAAAILT